ncbi:MAG: helix-turn-helix transcriptional regulator [Proteobacteria bacterium]|nr:helix-turn-helix transcriptional regulator [Pseudomonadota bacterium]
MAVERGGKRRRQNAGIPGSLDDRTEEKGIRPVPPGPQKAGGVRPRDAAIWYFRRSPSSIGRVGISATRIVSANTTGYHYYTHGTIGDRIRKIRKKSSVNQMEFAHSIGASNSVVSEWETTTDKFPNAKYLRRICDLYGIDANWLVLGTGPIHVEPKRDPKYSYVKFWRNEDGVWTTDTRPFWPDMLRFMEDAPDPSDMFLLLYPRGDMSPFVKKNDIVCIDARHVEPELGKIYLYRYREDFFLGRAISLDFDLFRSRTSGRRKAAYTNPTSTRYSVC